MRMFATVCDIEEGTIVDDLEHHDAFVSAMRGLVGQEIQIEPRQGKDGASWFDGISTVYTFHKSWLKWFREEE